MTGVETALLIGSTVVSAAGSVIGGYSQAQAQRQQAVISNEMAARERARAAIDAEEYQRKASKMQGQQRLLYGASGVAPDSGTPLAVQLETAKEGAFGAATILDEGALRSYRYNQEANLRRQAASDAIFSGYVGAGRSALTGGSALARRYGGSTSSDTTASDLVAIGSRGRGIPVGGEFGY